MSPWQQAIHHNHYVFMSYRINPPSFRTQHKDLEEEEVMIVVAEVVVIVEKEVVLEEEKVVIEEEELVIVESEMVIVEEEEVGVGSGGGGVYAEEGEAEGGYNGEGFGKHTGGRGSEG